jgi:DNA-binding XRE family transcriptional regulator
MVNHDQVTAVRRCKAKLAALHLKLKTLSFSGRLELEGLPPDTLARRTNELLPANVDPIDTTDLALWRNGHPCKPVYQLAVTKAQGRYLRGPTTGEKIRQARLDAGMTQFDVARFLGHSDQSTVSHYETNARLPADIEPLASIFGRLPEEFDNE